MSLKASKTFFGSASTEYWGHTLDKDSYRAAIHNVSPIRNMIVLTDVSELRCVLGRLVQHEDTIPRYSHLARPLHKLTCEGVKWAWSPECDACFEKLQQKNLDNNILASPDYAKEIRRL